MFYDIMYHFSLCALYMCIFNSLENLGLPFEYVIVIQSDLWVV